MKTISRFLLLMSLLSISCLGAVNEGVTVEVTIKGPTGGGANTLNSVSKREENGNLTLEADGNIVSKINHVYKIVSDDKGKMYLASKLTLTKTGEKDVIWEKKMELIIDQKIVQIPFKGFSMEIKSKGTIPHGIT